MGTTKRERQKANRQARLEQLAREARVRKTKKGAMRLTLLVLAVVAVVAVVYVANNGDDAIESATSTSVGSSAEVTVPQPCASPSTSVPETTSAPASTVAYVKPTVQIPAELPTELQVTTLKEGSGPEAKVCDTVKVHYVGVLSADGTEFDNSYDRGSPFDVTLGLNTVIQGWEQGLLGVQAGGQYQLDIPAALAYGDSGSGDVIKPGDAITFVVDVVSITPGTQNPDAATGTTTPSSSPDTTAPATTGAATTTTGG